MMNAQGQDDDLIRFFRLFNEEIAAGNNIGRTLRKAADLCAGTPLGAAAESVLTDVMVRDQTTMAQAMRKHPDVFDYRVVTAIEASEYGGILDRILPLIVQALEAGNLDLLVQQGVIPSQQACEYVSKVLGQVCNRGATDVHFESRSEGGHVRMRIDGVLQPVEGPAEELREGVINYLKMMGAMDPAQKLMPQNGVCDMPINRRNYRLRISVVPTLNGERIVVGLLIQDVGQVLMDIDKLCLSQENLAKARKLMHLPHGVVIVSGPAGCGKTTLLYSMLKELSSPQVSIVAIEDPVEIAFAGMAQIPIRPEAGLTYARAIRNALRQCPNILMVGEIRDLEVANLCLQAALSGHLVLSTLHVDTPVGVARRLVDMGVEPYLVSSNLAGVITSRLVRRLCPDCRQPAKPVPHALPKAAREWVAAHPDSTFYDVQGCDKCGSLGSRGRTAIHEVLVMTDRLRQMVTDGADVAQLRAAAVEEGTKPMLIDGLEKAAAGVTTIQEVLAALPLGTDP